MVQQSSLCRCSYPYTGPCRVGRANFCVVNCNSIHARKPKSLENAYRIPKGRVCVDRIAQKAQTQSSSWRMGNHNVEQRKERMTRKKEGAKKKPQKEKSSSTVVSAPNTLSGIHGPLSSGVAPCMASDRFSVCTSRSVTYALPSGNFMRTSNSWSSIMSSFHSRRWPSYTHNTRFFMRILSVGQPHDTG